MLINDIETLVRHNSAANNQLKWVELEPCVEMAERWLILNCIGQAFYDQLNTANTAGPLSAPQQALMPYLQRIISAKALLFFIPKSEAMITSTGVVRMETENKKTAYQNQVIKLNRQLQYEVETGVEDLLAFLNTHTPDYPLWLQSEQYRSSRQLFIQSGRQLAELHHFAAPYTIYNSLRPTLYDVEQQQVRPLLGEAFFSELKAKLQLPDPGWSAQELWLLQYLRKFITYTALHRGLASHLLTWDERGLTVFTAEGRSEYSDDAKRGSIDPAHVDFLHRQFAASAESWLQTLSYFLKETASTLVFPSWYNWQLAQQAANPHASSHTHTSFSL